MAETNSNTPIPAETWVNVSTAAKVSNCEDISIQNIGVTDLYYSISGTQPERASNAYRIFKRGEVIRIDATVYTAWVFSRTNNGLINVENVCDEIDLNSKNYKALDLLEQALIELRLLRMHHEIITDQIFKAEDIEE